MALAGGRADMIPVTSRDPEYSDQSGKREDGMNLINMWKKKMHDNGFEPAYVWNKTEFRNVNVEKTDRLLGNNTSQIYLHAISDSIFILYFTSI